MAPPTLMACAQRNLIRNLSSLQDVGDVPYEAVKPALRKIADPQQLRNIEIASPHIADSDSELWINFIKRDIPDWKTKLVEPKNPQSWWKVYRKMYREEKKAQEQQKKELAEKFKNHKMEKEKHSVHMLDTIVEQRFRQGAMIDGNINPKAGSYGFERVGSVANAKKKGTSIISAMRKECTRPSLHKNGAGVVQQRVWQKEIVPPGSRRKNAPNLLKRGPPSAMQQRTEAAFSKALRADERIKEERARKLSDTPQPSNTPAQSPPKTQATRPASTQPAKADQISSTAAPAATTPLGAGAGTKRPLSPEKAIPTPPQKRQRPAPSIFMPKRARR